MTISNLLRMSSDVMHRFSLSRSDFTTAHLHVIPVFQMDRGVLRTSLLSRIGISSDDDSKPHEDIERCDVGVLRMPLLSRIGILNNDDFEPPEDVERRDVLVFTIQTRLYNSPPSHYSSLSDGQEHAQDVPLIKNRYLEQQRFRMS
ncbi:hypothetical protein PISMIDRAFT_14279 [Pisolithus microcarpus 441]|uniref:Unplaced genomic scaffold scaffold_118, whole genome shotgun sequence n=1 Tax=Pisolithus microcarpus 441 TaxID=765257 RepID=A0A0C9Y1K9_9AGAM|nr:hypothetical protein PISMIDRAFT_14279 [Pisolithus microcarpus 441]